MPERKGRVDEHLPCSRGYGGVGWRREQLKMQLGRLAAAAGWTARGKRPGFNLWQAVDVNGFRAKATPPRAQDWSGNLNPDASKGARRWGPWTVVCW